MGDTSQIPEQLRRLVRKADANAVKADVVVREAIRDIRGALAVAADDEPVATSAAARERLFARIRARMAKLAKRLDDLIRASMNYAGKLAADRASEETGLQVRYSKRHADEVCALLSPAQGENLAAVFTDNMTKRVIGSLRTAVVSAFQENAVAGGTLKGLASAINRKWQRAARRSEVFQFRDAGGRIWDTRTYMAMNTRTNAMRLYNDLLVENIAKATGSDLVRVSQGGDPHCEGCFPWAGRILSVSGQTDGFPTYDEAKAAGCFHPNCIHTLEYVDETADADEIALQRKFPVEQGADSDAMYKNRREIDIARKMRDEGLSREAASVAVDRDNLAASMRAGLIRGDAGEVVAKMSDAQVSALCKGGRPPEFTPTKGTKKSPHPERWNHGSKGGVVHIARDASAERIAEVTHTTEREIATRFAQEWMNGTHPTPINLNGANATTLQEIQSAIGVTPSTNALTIAGGDLRHMVYKHAKHEHFRRQSPITATDIGELPSLLNSHNSMSPGTGGWRNGKFYPSVKIESRQGNSRLIAIFLVGKKIYPKSLWKKI